MSKMDQQKTVWEDEITSLKARVQELQIQRAKLEDELRPHKERERKENERAEDEKRASENDQRLVDTITRIEALVTKHVKDPLLKKSAFEYALSRGSMSMSMMGPWAYLR